MFSESWADLTAWRGVIFCTMNSVREVMHSSEPYFPRRSPRKPSKLSSSLRRRSVMPRKFPACSIALRMISSRCSDANTCWREREWVSEWERERERVSEWVSERVTGHSVDPSTHQSAEASVQHTEASLIVWELGEALQAAVIIRADHTVRLRVDLIDAARSHLQTHAPPRVAPVVLEAVIALRKHQQSYTVKNIPENIR